MIFDNKTGRLIFGALFLFLIVLSLSFYFLKQPWSPRVLFFPETVTGRLVGERRFLPPRRGLTANVELYVKELILGPADPLLSRVVPRDATLQSVLSRQGEVYVSLSKEIVDLSPDAALSFDQAMQAIASGVLYNFPHVKRLYLLVEGQLPGEHYADGFTFEKKLLK
ncbi:MAG: GerMN domain-containing protein [Spirochaetales bacterium]|nr:GerMN domain-containing protein [Spirochaetales bacterium]